MTNALKNTELVSSRIWIIMVESGQDGFYIAGVFTDENLALATLSDLRQRLEEEHAIHSEYSTNRISARLVSHPVHSSAPQYHMLYTVETMKNINGTDGWSVFSVRKDLHTTTSLFEYAQMNAAVARLLDNPTQAVRDEALSDDEMAFFVTFDPDLITFTSNHPAY